MHRSLDSEHYILCFSCPSIANGLSGGAAKSTLPTSAPPVSEGAAQLKKKKTKKGEEHEEEELCSVHDFAERQKPVKW